jgi:hypothetical protein
MKEAAVADSPRETLALARAAAGAVRSLNHATLGGEGLDWPADAYELIGELWLAPAGQTPPPPPPTRPCCPPPRPA